MSSNEWYTPAKYIEAAHDVMGGIDLDPASCAMANQTVKAIHYYSQEDNGLVQPWYGRVWLNPPFSRNMHVSGDKRSNIAKWLDRLLEEYRIGNIEQAIMLAPSLIYSRWFGLLWSYPICFPDHQVWFYVPDGSHKKSRKGWKTDAHMFGTVFFYLGPHEQRFIEVFSQFGRIARAIDTPKPKPYNLDLWSA